MIRYPILFTILLILSDSLANAQEQVVFVSERAGHEQIYRQKTVGGLIEKLTLQGPDFQPSLSFDGGRVAFVSEID